MKLDEKNRRLGDVSGRTVLVTGASSGIGLATVRALLAGGAKVHAVARHVDALSRDFPAEAGAGELVPHSLDVADGAAVQRLADELAASDSLDTVVLAAGQNINPRTFGDVDFDAFDKLMRVNLNGVFYVLRSMIKQLRENRGDAIIISSVAAFWPDHSGAAYQASKAGISALARGAAWDEHGRGVRFTTIYPGVVNTPILDKRPTPPPANIRQWFIQPEDVANVIISSMTIPGRTTVSEVTLVATRLQSIGNTQQATPVIPEGLE